jgi:hypothetical protein
MSARTMRTFFSAVGFCCSRPISNARNG